MKDYVPVTVKVTEHQVDPANFGVTDEKGRVVGAEMITSMEIISQDERPMTSWGQIAKPDTLGVWFLYSIQSTRNGKRFGASASLMRFRDEAERNAKAVKALARSLHRATKKFA